MDRHAPHGKEVATCLLQGRFLAETAVKLLATKVLCTRGGGQGKRPRAMGNASGQGPRPKAKAQGRGQWQWPMDMARWTWPLAIGHGHMAMHNQPDRIPELAQVRIFGNLIEDLPARAARENFGKSALAEGPDRH